MKQLILYSANDCELCLVARDLIYASLPVDSYSLEIVDVRSSLDLKKQFGLKIPVLGLAECDALLNWPFDQVGLIEFMART